jgi:hypothetical protein
MACYPEAALSPSGFSRARVLGVDEMKRIEEHMGRCSSLPMHGT